MSDEPKTVEALRTKWNAIPSRNQISIGPGWVPIVDAVLTRLEKLGKVNFSSFECKQKFGELRIYYLLVNQPDLLQDSQEIFDLATFEASTTCEQCGKDGSLCQVGGWLSVRCPACQKDNDKLPRY